MEPRTAEPAWAAFESGDWERAAREFRAAIEVDSSPELIDGLGRALWWLKDVPAAIDVRTTAYGAYRESAQLREAAGVAVWLARELHTLFRNDAAADGWLARAETIASGLEASSITGWISLARAEAYSRPAEAGALCRSALDAARTHRDSDLELVVLSRLGLIEITTGDVELGTRHIAESMAAATGGEARDPQSVAEAYCALMEAAELLGDSDRFAQWTTAIAAATEIHGLGPLGSLSSSTAYGNLSAFCSACCGGMYLVTGRLDDAEAELQRAIGELEQSGMHSRCVHPITQLAELRVLQGRFEEARALLAEYEDLPRGDPTTGGARPCGRRPADRCVPAGASSRGARERDGRHARPSHRACGRLPRPR